jgi:hypothetical protein
MSSLAQSALLPCRGPFSCTEAINAICCSAEVFSHRAVQSLPAAIQGRCGPDPMRSAVTLPLLLIREVKPARPWDKSRIEF